MVIVVCALLAVVALILGGLAARAVWANRPRPARVYTPSRAQRRVAATRAHENGDPDATVVLPVTWR